MANSRSKPKASKVRFEETKDKNDGSSSVKITFSFKSFLGQDSKGNGQDLEKWQEDKILSNLLDKLKHLSNLTRQKAHAENSLVIYGKFPENSDFACPQHLSEIQDWGTIRKLGCGGKVRVAGYYSENSVFNIVFLDKEHRFFPTDIN